MKRQETLTNAIHHTTTKVWLSCLALVASLATSSPTYGLAINIDASSALAANTAALNAFNRAADRWESIFSDPITVTIEADFYDFGSSSSLGKTSSIQLAGSYDFIRNLMINDGIDETDDNIVGFLPDSSYFSAFVPSGIYLDGLIQATKANLKALGLTWLDDVFSATDAVVEFNSAYGFDFDSTDGIGSGLIDFEAVATHEIGHVLGFTSSVNFIDELVYLGITNYLVSVRPLDLFRFYDGFFPTTPDEFASFPRTLWPGAPSHFNDLTHQYSMSTGQYLGDGWQANHWKESELLSNVIGIMDPAVMEGEQVAISGADIRALDVIGWDYEASIPEPGSLVLLSIGLASLGFMRRQMRSASTII